MGYFRIQEGDLLKETSQRTSNALSAFNLLFLLPFFSGSAALSHELLWTRRLIDLLGATDWVLGRVLGLFFLGLSLGGYLATLSRNNKSPAINRLIKTELLIGLLALPAVFLPLWTDWIWQAIGTEVLVSWIGELVKLVLTILVVMPPAIAMGFTLPLFINMVSTGRVSKVESVGVWVYGANTFGGVFGLWFTSTYLISWFGAQWSMLAVCLLNLVIAGTLWLQKRLDYRVFESQADCLIDPSKGPLTTPWRQSRLLQMAFVSGFLVLAFEILLLRLISLVVPSSYHTTSALLANVILFLAVGSWIVSFASTLSFTKNLVKNRYTLPLILFSAALGIIVCPLLLYESTSKLISIRYLQGLHGQTIDSIAHYWTLVFWLVAVSAGLALLLVGLIFPILLTKSSEGDPAGKQVGLLLAVNGIGGLVGTELFNSLVIPYFGIYNGFAILAGLVLITTGLVSLKTHRWFSVCLTSLLGLAVFSAYQSVSQLHYLSPNAKRYKEKQTHFGRDGVWLIVEKDSGAIGISVNNQYFLGGNGGTIAQRRNLRLAWALKPDAKSVCCLGLATGITASGLELLENPPPITAIELSENVVELAKKYFQKESGPFFSRPENEVIVEDARTYMAASHNKFDLIVGDLYRPFGLGEGRLYSVEHFRNVKSALTPEGIFCQWIPAYQLNEENWITIATTFQKVFPEALVVYGSPNVNFPVIGLVGRKDNQKWDQEILTKQLKSIPNSMIQRDPLLKSADVLIAGILRRNFSANKLNTLDNLAVEISAGTHWTLKDLRKNRIEQYDKELIKGKHFATFTARLTQWIDPVLPAENFLRLKREIEKKILKKKKQSTVRK